MRLTLIWFRFYFEKARGLVFSSSNWFNQFFWKAISWGIEEIENDFEINWIVPIIEIEGALDLIDFELIFSKACKKRWNFSVKDFIETLLRILKKFNWSHSYVETNFNRKFDWSYEKWIKYLNIMIREKSLMLELIWTSTLSSSFSFLRYLYNPK